MQKNPELLIILFFLVFLLLLILALVISFFRYLKKRDRKDSNKEMNAIADAFKTIGNEINTLKEQLTIKDQLATIGEISAGIAHQIKNPLAVIAGYTKLILKSVDEKDEKKPMLEAILKETDEINRIIEELFKLSRHEEIKKSKIDITRLIKDIIEENPNFREKVTILENKPFFANVDKILLSQVIKNLLQNAIDASSEAKVELKGYTFSNKEGLLVNIINSGIVIPKENRDKLFKPFFTTKPDGMGIGLTISHKIITAHGGSIWLNAQNEEATVFSIFLPFN
ncbi:MAG: ATP-binding protein [Thermodesulfovibrionales bacterium]|nr:ATP-binding protein [Thermodesulfovibrionales bacterium]